jgi:hypothetical protein
MFSSATLPNLAEPGVIAIGAALGAVIGEQSPGRSVTVLGGSTVIDLTLSRWWERSSRRRDKRRGTAHPVK